MTEEVFSWYLIEQNIKNLHRKSRFRENKLENGKLF